MDCWYPITVPRHNNYKGKDGLVYTHVYGRMSVPCGRCPPCRRRKQNEWAYRILEECKHSKLTAFVTLTYDDDNLVFTDDGLATLFPDHLTKFFKDLRYDLGKCTFRYFACGEYGDQFERPHYHLCFFYNGDLTHDQLSDIIQYRWTHGFIDYEEDITPGRAKYCAKYSMKQIGFDYGSARTPFARMSRRPGIGKQFLDHIDFNLFRERDVWFVHDLQGTPYSLPRYYKERIYSKDQIDQHSMLLEKLKNLKFDYHLSTRNDIHNYHEFLSDRIVNQERLFIKHLKQENYGFRYKFPEFKRVQISRFDDLFTDEF